MSLELKTSSPGFVPCMLYHMNRICEDNNQRVALSKQPNLPPQAVSDILSKGIWYGGEYCQALKKHNKMTRLDALVERGHSFHGFMPKTFIGMEDAILPTKRKICEFRSAKDVSPSAALDSMEDSVCLLECASVVSVAAYRSLKDILGKEKFDLLFAAAGKTPLQIGRSHDNPYLRVFSFMTLTEPTSVRPGDICYFSNIEDVLRKHPFAPNRGYNLICQSIANPEQPTFSGLGLKLNSSIEEVDAALLRDFNVPQESELFFNEAVVNYKYEKDFLQDRIKNKKLFTTYANVTYTPEEFNGKKPLLKKEQLFVDKAERMLRDVLRPNLEKIDKLVQAPLSQVCKIFESMKLME